MPTCWQRNAQFNASGGRCTAPGRLDLKLASGGEGIAGRSLSVSTRCPLAQARAAPNGKVTGSHIARDPLLPQLPTAALFQVAGRLRELCLPSIRAMRACLMDHGNYRHSVFIFPPLSGSHYSTVTLSFLTHPTLSSPCLSPPLYVFYVQREDWPRHKVFCKKPKA